MKFRKKPVVIEAIQWTGKNQVEVSAFMGGQELNLNSQGIGTIMIRTLEGRLIALKEDWIIKGVKGELYPCKPDIFEQTYEPVLDSKGGK